MFGLQTPTIRGPAAGTVYAHHHKIEPPVGCAMLVPAGVALIDGLAAIRGVETVGRMSDAQLWDMGALLEPWGPGVWKYASARIIDRSGEKQLPIGDDSFASAIEGSVVVDKAGLIADVLNDGYKCMLFCRPRRFGKTFNMTMLRAFFELPSESDGSARFRAAFRRHLHSPRPREPAAERRKNAACLRFNSRSPRIGANRPFTTRHLPGETIKPPRKLKLRQN